MISTIYYIWASPVAQRVKKPPAMEETQEAWVLPVGWEDPLEEGMATLPIFLPGKSHEQRSLAGYTPWYPKRVRHDLVTKQQ